MLFWEICLDDKKKILGKYSKEYFSEAKIGEIAKIIHATYIREGHNLIIRSSKK